ncbi:MAG: type IV pilus assembly protein PilM, partial [Planctomycetes bacterium]|nr:type IV pilus assembly protein PilM [Planctomycetota bacterium]
MARGDAIWAIDVGQCAFKALRCRLHDEADDRIVAEAFDYIEYPKILTQPGADPGELVAEALQQFLSRNDVRGTRVAVSVSGQNALARFIKLPPVESKKIPDIVRYEAKQQIPFALEDVKFEYQQMGVGSEEEGFALDTEIGLFAMKLDQLYRALRPFQNAGIEMDLVQLTPLALYNYLLFDQLHNLPSADEYDPDDPPESTVIMSLGTDATDLVVTNGYRVWQRSIPLGGNHFTKALTKELKLTFAKAEHLKRNATQAQDPKAVFQAMRPVFNDLVTEVQRSIGFFCSLDRKAKIGRLVALGNVMKLPGLQGYLAKSLGYDVKRVETFRGLVGPEVVTAPAFAGNIMGFGVCYGLAVQGLDLGKMRTNMLPRSMADARLIRQKKPWALASAATLLLACTISYASFSRAVETVDEAKWKAAELKVGAVVTAAATLDTKRTAETTQFD